MTKEEVQREIERILESHNEELQTLLADGYRVTITLTKNAPFDVEVAGGTTGLNQRQQVIDALRQLGGFARLEDLYNAVDTSTWATKTPKASIRRILQSSKDVFMIEPGFWGLKECCEQIEDKIKSGNI